MTSAQIEARARRLLGHPDTRPLTDDQRLALHNRLHLYLRHWIAA